MRSKHFDEKNTINFVFVQTYFFAWRVQCIESTVHGEYSAWRVLSVQCWANLQEEPKRYLIKLIDKNIDIACTKVQ